MEGTPRPATIPVTGIATATATAMIGVVPLLVWFVVVRPGTG